MPIHFMHKSVSFEELISLYAVSDVCLVSSTRDGMNLVSYEYIATQRKRHGVMILSEFAGAAQSLNGSIVVNPWNTEELANALYDAVTMDDEQRKINYEKLTAYVSKFTSAWWGQSFLEELAGREYGERSKTIKVRQGTMVHGIEKLFPAGLIVSMEEDEQDGAERRADGGAVQPVYLPSRHRQHKSA
jgi:trehalose 6-phosphate synthase